MTASASSAEVAGSASAARAVPARERTAAPAARRRPSWSAESPRPTATSSGAVMAPNVGILASSPALPVKATVASAVSKALSTASIEERGPCGPDTNPTTNASVSNETGSAEFSRTVVT
ncbi:hypothetical protein GCM10020219_040930 [Nonomuraea dietziae]